MSKIKSYQYIENPIIPGGLGKMAWIDIDEPTCDDFGAILRPIALAPCTSDTHAMHNTYPVLPHAFGHEGLGEVIKVGKYVKDFKPGDRVAISCPPSPNWISPEAFDKYPAKGIRGNFENKMLWSELFPVVLADYNLAHIPEGVSDVQALMAPDMMATGFAAAKAANITFGDTVVVVGIGPVGLMAIRAAVLQGAGKIFAIGSRKACVDVAYQYGATKVIDYHGVDIYEEVLKANNGKRVDSVIIIGSEDSSLIGRALACVKMGGVIANAAAYFDGKDITLPFKDFNFGLNETIIRGVSLEYGRQALNRFMALIQTGRVDPSLLVSHTFYGFESLPKAVELMNSKAPDVIKPAVLID